MSFLLTKKVFIPDILAEKWKNSSAVRMWLLVAACKDLLAASRFKVPPVPSYAPIDFFYSMIYIDLKYLKFEKIKPIAISLKI